MSRFLPAVTLAGLLAIALAGAGLAQTGSLAGLVQPLVINVDQQVPVQVTLALPLDDGTVVTATAPLTVAISLQIAVDGANVVAAAAGEAVPAVGEAAPAAGSAIKSAAPSGVDAEGRSYVLEPGKGMEIASVYSSINSLGGIQVVGELTNVSDAEMKYVEVVGTFYDANGTVVLVETTYADLDTIAPGQSSPFKIMALRETAVPVASYRIQTSQ